MKKHHFLAALFLTFSFYGSIAQNSFKILITAFNEKVPLSYFEDLSGLQIERDHNDLYKVYMGKYTTKEEAEKALSSVKSKGYSYARIVDFDEIAKVCAPGCSEPIYVQNIFFDFDKYYLRSVSKANLDKLAVLLNDNPGFRVELTAHTDSKGSNDYNDNLSKNRAESARDYLIAKGIAQKRIMISYSGELTPIAKNTIDGSDSPTGRQLNRRVEITVIDANNKIVPNIVKEIIVPSDLLF